MESLFGRHQSNVTSHQVAPAPSSTREAVTATLSSTICRTTCRTICRFLLVLAFLAPPLTASAQDVPLITEDQFLGGDQQGETITVPLVVENLNQAAGINSYGITLSYGEAPVDFVKFETDSTLTSAAGFTTAEDDNEEAAQATIGAFGTTPLNTGRDSGAVVRAVFEVTSGGSGSVTFPEVTLNGSSAPGVDLTQADFTVVVGAATTIGEAREQGPGTAIAVEGTVTRAFGTHVRLQDGSGPTGASGLAISQEEGPLSDRFQGDIQSGAIAPGTRLRFTGLLSERGGLLLVQNGDLDSYSVEGQELPPFPQEISLFEVKGPGGEDFESELIRAGGVSFTDPDATGGVLEAETTYEVEAEDGTTFDYRVGPESETEVVGAEIPQGTFTYEGVLGQDNGGSGTDEGYRLVPVRTSSGLPVEMTGFTATATGSGALLKWRTASETGNAGFEVQHQGPGATSFESAGFVEGAGTTASPQNYQYRLPSLEPGTHRFRLQQRDTDGTTSLTDPVALSIEAERALTFDTTGPNPVRREARFAFTVRQTGPAKVRLYNALGQRVETLFSETATAGERYAVQVSVADLPTGKYFVQLSGPSGTRVQQIVTAR